ncbi:hypothetical protein O6H91_08G114400 [Diphasiastrum complanatum]|uniref:Uncharacterized protein n=1 Tax=Diphasiastrum complanatum TaxID=34168 RepID=A0ACC2D1A8_DIPCM|nr:hypothetical protein O6H91_Y032000 [Diphasiastrum complanatum]KAJ7548029.1 hypothetical protein O6H91_08G114400 [Diphasiastrum complanatum]
MSGDRRMQVYNSDGYPNSFGTSYPESIPPEKFKKKTETSRSWSLYNDPELKRKTRVASYKAYSVEGRVKSSVKRSFRWLKEKYLEVRYGWW